MVRPSSWAIGSKIHVTCKNRTMLWYMNTCILHAYGVNLYYTLGFSLRTTYCMYFLVVSRFFPVYMYVHVDQGLYVYAIESTKGNTASADNPPSIVQLILTLKFTIFLFRYFLDSLGY